MSWRTVVITTRCKLDLKMDYMVVRGEDTKRIFLDEIAMLLIENPAVSFTGCLLEALVEKKIRVVFCNEKRSPIAELAPYYGSYDCSRKIKAQIAWSETTKGTVWADIISEKIRKQSDFLKELKKEKEAELIRSYLGQIELYDTTNREGHAAKVYFNAVFGMGFTRSDECLTNAALNYGYGIMLSAFNREITACGYLTQLGIFHSNMFNYYNLSCDLMEPFRILVDRTVKNMELTSFESREKHALWNILNDYVYIGHTKQTVLNAIKLYLRSVFDALNDNDSSEIKFYFLQKEK
ncbi:MAG: type II CRISPR-associated endonuclease Cas1 [Clostridiales bacterium]|nr:type II CRISPR-associated endonuclease Cas1 [Clostridiales bacterium]